MSEQNTEHERGFDLTRLWWVPLIGLLLVIVLMLALRGFVRDVLALPIAHLLWFAELAFKSIPQSICWSALLIIVVVVALKSLGRLRGVSSPRPKPPSPRLGRVAMWTERIELSLTGKYSRHRLGYYLGKLIIDVLAYDERLDSREIGRRVEQGELVLPPDVETYLMARLQPGLATHPGFWAQLKTLVGLEHRVSVPLTHELERVVQFLEDREVGE